MSDVKNKTKTEILKERTTDVGSKEENKSPPGRQVTKMKPNKSKVSEELEEKIIRMRK